MKRHLSLLILGMLLGIAGTFAQGGQTGSLTWNLNNGKLTISGEGVIPNYTYSQPPWHEYFELIKTVVIENGVTRIGDNAFHDFPYLTNINIPTTVTSMGSRAFASCPILKTINLPNGLTNIGYRAFERCYIINLIDIPNSVTSIGESAFEECYGLTSITLPSSVTYINSRGFAFCSNLVSITNENPEPINIPNDVFVGMDQNACKLRVQASSVSAYNNANVWKNFVVVGICSVSVSANNDEFGETSGSGIYEVNAMAIIKATQKNGYKFINWTKDGIEVSTFKQYSFIVIEDVELVGNFEEITTYSVNVYANNSEYGTVTGSAVYEENAIATIEATAFEDYKFINWTKNGVEISNDNPYKFIVTEDVELVANFQPNVGIITIEFDAVKIYPNPTKGELRIESGKLRSDDVEIFDIYGKKQNAKSKKQKEEILMDISHFSAGIYFVKINTEAGNVLRKVVKE